MQPLLNRFKEYFKNKENKKTLTFAVLLGLLALVLFGSYYYMTYERPSQLNPLGYYGAYDQSQYLEMAKEMSDFKLATFTYGIGYPILGAMFYRIYPKDPFMPVNFFFFIGTAIMTFYASRKIFENSNAKGALVTILFLLSTSIVNYVVMPWNSTVNLFLFSIIFYIVISKKISLPRVLIVAVCVAWIFAARYIDIFFIGPFLLAWFYTNRKEKKIIQNFIIFCIGMVLLVAPVFYLHNKYFGGPLKTPYTTHMRDDGYSDQDLQRYDLGEVSDSWFTLLFGLRTPDDLLYPPLLKTAPIFFLFPLAIWGLIRRKSLLLWSLFLGMVTAFIFYGSFPAFNGFSVRYGCVHYIKMWFPFITLMIFVGMVEIANTLSLKSKQLRN